MSRLIGEIDEGLALQRIPRATYRLQFNQRFTFQQARAIIPYLYELGISDCYASPIFKSRAGSQHGYDICDHSQFNPEIGGEEQFATFSQDLRTHDLGLILDVVPNHMGIADPSNVWWLDVLENGPSSSYSTFFDIDWHPVKVELENKVLLPLLEDQYGRVLENGKIQLAYENGAFFLCHYETRLPLTPRSYSQILSYRIEEIAQRLGEENEHLQELRSILTAISYLPSRTESAPEKIVERNREKEIIKRRLATLYNSCHNMRSAVDETVRMFNGIPGSPHSFDLLHELIDAQPYRPAFWRVATEEINYRRFFDTNELAAIRVELPEVFRATHQLVFRLLKEGRVNGLRIDHPDGLWDPPRYFQRLQEGHALHRMQTDCAEGPDLISVEADIVQARLSSWFDNKMVRAANHEWPLYVIAEKILLEGELLPEDWAVHGTTGYDFLNDLNGLFVDSSNRKVLDRIFRQFTQTQSNFRHLVNATKKMTMLVSMAAEINALSHRLDCISEKNRRYRDFTLNSLTHAIREVIACLPVYRTYISGQKAPSERDLGYIQIAIAEAKRLNPRTPRAIFNFIEDTLLLRNLDDFREEDRPHLIHFVMRFQQITGPVMAKGLEDTAFYVYNRFVSLNEVGGNPEQFGISPAAFHLRNQERQRRWPHSLLATSTHDTKRSEDVRARMNVLSEMPKEWRAALTQWSRFNANKKTHVNGMAMPDRNDEYLLYQTLIGTWPTEAVSPAEAESFRERISAYMLKATKEAKVHTSWINPNDTYDAAVRDFIHKILANMETSRFAQDFRAFQRRVMYFGQINSLAQVLLKLTSPGIPDIYQGTELWDFSLVDPDNRRPIDYQRRQELLDDLKRRLEKSGDNWTTLVTELLNSSQDGQVKLYLTYQTLRFRRDHPKLFSQGAYLPLKVLGESAEHVVGFERVWENESILVIVPRFLARLTACSENLVRGGNIWGDTSVVLSNGKSGNCFRNILTGELVTAETQAGGIRLPLSAVFQFFPVALLKQVPPNL